ncbi:MAG: hypothetical protein A2268_13005 [Candidatus Raymondbacteria bacterium RifOxyA12_full_50_37]|uniref:HMA domain-containing protein n=1 Tax=Candidatus Raymondbacteria bacterium RIFOXYD12_FULL_49_13 TaxID=1817890 RepID=A0A1F7F023_UNCRA|nr:MAG: hypothetical protein A2268_13005 [Candidatus Raymondbacteria bacterium RifOxyA12_full_50_37]OGJ88722.1 MAG: hypothetical protein A2350_01490 [Candidatus Raymondbacteria bacterium RifOxyB12_full_50_8]OGJ92983.1 MAG: hypothetical protein A2248_18140 [Candidatus Raymondbacteria bacterium RIFOXYA2_FULL_49_16]OGJ97663.1 MAG: hypothetical protein A2487_13130 [Candidatus Raymondbacteria bacterium RifOxyC12_full_50_8]OGJ99896.1 MAG: hypothetical protein A2519_00120 [Candidatus Raymondbacteria b
MAVKTMFMDMAPYILLGLVFVGILHVFFSKDMVVRHVGKNSIWSVIKSALFGIPLPLCSCGVIPAAVYMNRNGASKGATVSFLISTPQTGIDSIVATYGMLGPLFAIFRPVAAFIMGIIGGIAVLVSDKTPKSAMSQNSMEPLPELAETAVASRTLPAIFSHMREMGRYAFVEFLDDIALQFTVGIIISGLIAWLIPDDFFAATPFHNGMAGMLLMIVIGVPMYVCATASIPVAVALMMKGFSPGVAYVFLVVGPATNAASLTIVMNALGKKMTALYLGVIIACAIGFGYALDLLVPALGGISLVHTQHVHSDALILTPAVKTVLSVIFLALLARSLVWTRVFGKKDSTVQKAGTLQFSIAGMTCSHCVANVTNAISSVAGVESTDVSLDKKTAFVSGPFDPRVVIAAVEKAGYRAKQLA